jgi:predicted transcriptional regulator
MKQILVEIDDEIAEKLERVAPGRARRRSAFVRTAIQRLLWELEEQATAAAYRNDPDSPAEAYVDASVWEPKRSWRRTRK